MFFSASPPRWQALRRWGLVVSVAGSVLAATAIQARERAPEAAFAANAVALSALPAEAQQTHRLILSGGPFPFPKDCTVFGNRERALPIEPRGHYREYTVRTPGSRDRGARRIVCGGRSPAQPQSCFYTSDHYASFRQIAP